MLEELHISGVATYPAQSQTVDGLQKLNFFFGTNGSGKTTISRLINDPAAHPTCGVVWARGRPLQALVYNSDFVDRNFISQMPGIFTLGHTNADTLQKIADASREVVEFEGQVGNLKTTLGDHGQSTGKLGDLRALRTTFEDECWTLKTTHDPHFQQAFEGVRAAKNRFCDRIVSEHGANTSALHPLDDLKERAGTVFAEGVLALPELAPIDGAELVALEGDETLKKKIIGKENVDIAGLIRRLGNSDWVRQGLGFIEGADHPCPFCQQNVDAELYDKLSSFFDEAYVADLAALDRLADAYNVHAEPLLEAAHAALASESTHINVEVLRPLVGQLDAVVELNRRQIDRKRNEPSAPVTLDPAGDTIRHVAEIVTKANEQIRVHNALVENLAAERTKLTGEIWKCLLEVKKDVIGRYVADKDAVDRAVVGITTNLDAKKARLAGARAALAELELAVTSVEPTVTQINNTLASFGFTSFRLATSGDRGNLYAILRGDGTDATATLSEGERSFITFLYFYHLISGSTSESGITADRIVVFDDPVSSLDSDVLFIVSSLIRRILSNVEIGAGQVKQVFVLTHNIYFHKEVSFDPKRGKDQKRAHESFWVVRKSDNASVVTSYPFNPVKTSYELLWQEVANENRSNLTIQNTLRRIIEHYFTILGNMDKDAVVAKFDGRDAQIAASLFSWINDGSHSSMDEIYVAQDVQTVARYLAVFKQIFARTEHIAHYNMMMRIDPGAATPAGSVATIIAGAASAPVAGPAPAPAAAGPAPSAAGN